MSTGPRAVKLATTAAVAALGPGAAALLGHDTVHLVLAAAWAVAVPVAGFFLGAFGKTRAHWNDRLSTGLDESIQRLASGYTRAYLRHVRADNRYVKLMGVTTRGEFTLSLDDVFVHLSMNAEPVHALDADPLGRRRAGGIHSVWHWLERARLDHQALAIVGPPGNGKTTLLRHVAYELASRRRARLPVLVTLRDHRELLSGAEALPSLAGLIRAALPALARPVPPGWVEARLRRGGVILILDGLDELADPSVRRRLCAWVDQQRAAYQETLFVVSSRPFGYRENSLEVAAVVQVNPFTEAQIDRFLRLWYRTTITRSYGERNESALLEAAAGHADLMTRVRATPALQEMAANPLLLTMIANVHHYRGALPGTRSELYAEVCDVFLAKRH